MSLAKLLKTELSTRSERNPSYSVRSFARDLKMDAGNLSRILSGKYLPRKKTQAKILLKLGYEPDSANAILEKELKLDAYFSDADETHFLSESEWYYDAILEAVRLKGFRNSKKWLSAKLKLSQVKVQSFLDRLVELGLLKIDRQGRWSDESGNISSYKNPLVSSEARRRKQKQILDKSQNAIESVDVTSRDHSSTLLCISESDIPKAKEFIREFHEKFSKKFERSGSKAESLYQVHTGFYPVISGRTKTEERKK